MNEASERRAETEPKTIPVGTETMSSGLKTAHNFHRWTFEWIAPYVRGRVLDIGGGTGNHLQYLRDRELVSIDLSHDAVVDLRKDFRDVPSFRFEVGDVTSSATVDSLGRGSFDTVLSCNVFEHIEDDAAAFRNAWDLLKPGGLLVLVLPAHRVLYGGMDRMAGHHRRYDRALAESRLRDAKFEVHRLRYVNALGAVGWFVNNRILSHDDLSSSAVNTQIGVFDRVLVPALRRIEGDRSLPFGQSLICVGQRPRESRP